MSDYPVFANAPITEAILDIRAQLPKESNLKILEKFQDYIKERFPDKKERRFFESSIKLSKAEKSSSFPTASGIKGYIFQSHQAKKVVQSRLDGFTFNKLKPYANWELFRSEGHELWEIYSKIAKPIKVVRIALRYINRIEVPLPLKDFKDYLLTTPEIAPELPQTVSNFYMRLEIPNPDIEATAIITQTMDKPTRSPKLPLILDIDVIKNTDYVENLAKMWEDFENLRDFKNDIFFNSITEKTKELFK